MRGLKLIVSLALTVVASAAEIGNDQEHVAVIGAGFSGLTAACELRNLGYKVTLFDKHAEVGGRARTFKTEEGFTFDYGPSWYWMPGIFDHIFARYGRTVSEFYNLTLLDPAYRVEMPDGSTVDMPGTYEGILDFAKLRSGPESVLPLELFFADAKEMFEQGVYDFIWKPMVSFTELLNFDLVRAGAEMNMFSGFASHLSEFTDDSLLHMLLKWPVIFIGASPDDAASMYGLMTYAGHVRGTWYPDGGLSAPALALAQIAEDLGVELRMGNEVNSFEYKASKEGEQTDTITSVCVKSGECTAVDGVLAAADYHFVEQTLLPEHLRTYDTSFWERQIMSPSTILFYLGFDRQLPGLLHHTFFFDKELDEHLDHVFAREAPRGEFASNPTFYLSATSKTDPFVTPSPEFGEAIFVLIPIHHRLNGTDTEEVRQEMLEMVLDRVGARLELKCALAKDESKAWKEDKELPEVCEGAFNLRQSIIYKRSYGPSDFEDDHNSFRGNAFGLANVLTQSLILKPTINAKPINMAFAGHLTSPGPGVPPSLVSGVVAAGVLQAKLNNPNFNDLSFLGLIATLARDTPVGVWLVTVALAVFLVLCVVRPAIEVSLAMALTFFLPTPLGQDLPFQGDNLSFWELLTRSRSYVHCAELLYRNGRTYFCAATMMDIRTFLDTSANYALFRVADDFVDNDDLRMRAAELDGETGRMIPSLYAAGAKNRGALLAKFEEDFWLCWNAAKLAVAGKGVAMSITEVYALHPIFPAVIESAIRVGFEDDMYHRFFRAMSTDARAETPVRDDQVARLKQAEKDAGLTPSTSFAYVGQVCRDMEEMLLYMDGSAAVIGDFMVPLLIPLPIRSQFDSEELFEKAKSECLATRKRALPHARSLGNAFQVTNFLRDIDEDTDLARQYVPTDICAKHGIYGKPLTSEFHRDNNGRRIVGYPLTAADHVKSIYDQPGFVPMMEEMLQNTEDMYADADKGIAMLGPSANIILMARTAYAAIHEKIRDGDYKIYDQRFRVPMSGKLKVAKRILRRREVVHIACVEMFSSLVTAFVGAMRALDTVASRITIPVMLFLAVLAFTYPESTPEIHPALASSSFISTAAAGWSAIVSALSFDGWISTTGAFARLVKCSYLDFLCIFTFPFIILAWTLAWLSLSQKSTNPVARRITFGAVVFWSFALCIVATLYSLPWDDFLVANRVWWYGPDRVLTDYLVNHIPAEEVAFFSLQTVLLCGIWLLWFNSRSYALDKTIVLSIPLNLPESDAVSLLRTRRRGYVVLAALQSLGVACLFGKGLGLGVQGTYLGLIVSWVTPVFALQWYVGAECLTDNWRPITEVVTFVAFCLALSDRWAIRRGIWHINEDTSVSPWIVSIFLGPDLPFEEAFFFVVTSIMCMGGLTMAAITTRSWREGQASYCQTLASLHTWGCSAAVTTAARETHTKPSKAKLLSIVAEYGAILGAVGHHPVATATALQYLYALALTGPEANAMAIASLPALRSLRVLQLVCVVAAAVGKWRHLERDDCLYRLLRLIALNVIFVALPPVQALGAALLVPTLHHMSSLTGKGQMASS